MIMARARGRAHSRCLAVFLLSIHSTIGCVHASSPLELTSPDPAQDQGKIAGYYSREADFYRLKAAELSQRVLVYEGLFGPDSEWVKGTRLLVQFYEDAAKEHERLAGLHLSLAGHGRQASSVKPASP
jgi:hypothetical protein